MKRVTCQLQWLAGLCMLAGLLVGFALSGCSSLVDSNPSTPAPETKVGNYYLPLTAINAEYNYSVTSTAPYYPTSGRLSMSMRGNTDTFQNMPVYACLWSYANYGTPEDWYYCLADTEAAEMGLEPSEDHYTDYWVDLKAPLEQNATWSFVSKGEQVTAKVTAYGSSAQVEGKTYNDVTMVEYTGANGTTGTEWFARGVGPIFYHVERPNRGMVENQLLSVKQR